MATNVLNCRIPWLLFFYRLGMPVGRPALGADFGLGSAFRNHLPPNETAMNAPVGKPLLFFHTYHYRSNGVRCHYGGKILKNIWTLTYSKSIIFVKVKICF
jgi:hypothetical protein